MDDKNRASRKSLCPSKDVKYSVSRQKVFEWIGNSLGCEVGGVGDLTDGVVLCDLTNKVFPGAIRPAAVRRPKAPGKGEELRPHEIEANFSLVKRALIKVGVKEQLAVDKIAQGRLHECLNFARWLMEEFMKRYGTCSEEGTAGCAVRPERSAEKENEKAVPRNAELERDLDVAAKAATNASDPQNEKMKKIREICDTARNEGITCIWLDKIKNVLNEPLGDEEEGGPTTSNEDHLSS
ncbi:hypothetical protein V5799_020956 [Amblyomma americanum]|uniref:Calponin-homology (CH) domain-containing protein n=1 Tax=Amblyomma americanum TaxID=6943 RepID=A0AAQ4ET83_AMBAM